MSSFLDPIQNYELGACDEFSIEFEETHFIDSGFDDSPTSQVAEPKLGLSHSELNTF